MLPWALRRALGLGLASTGANYAHEIGQANSRGIDRTLQFYRDLRGATIG